MLPHAEFPADENECTGHEVEWEDDHSGRYATPIRIIRVAVANTLASARAHSLPPLAVTWAQRSSSSDAEKNHVFLTISVPDVSKDKIKLDIQPGFINFQGYSETKKATYAVKLEFYADIDPSASKINHTPRDVEMVLQKKELNEAFWPRLLKDKAKVHFLKTDFDKVSVE